MTTLTLPSSGPPARTKPEAFSTRLTYWGYAAANPRLISFLNSAGSLYRYVIAASTCEC